jgi:glucose-6-phosphate dehydrogenase assembly protein OpcA
LEEAVNRDLHDTKSSAILTALTEARRGSGNAALGMVLTLIIDVNENEHYDALHAANSAAREHPCRIVTVIRRPGKSAPRLDAEIRVGQENLLGEVIVLRLYGVLRDQADSIVLPMLLPDAPVLVWWPGQGPLIPSLDQLGLLAQRRVTDAASSSSPTASLRQRAQGHSPGDTDFAWTRITPWRSLLAAALDQPFDDMVGGEVSGVRGNASAELLAAWLEDRLGIDIVRKTTRGPGITGVRLITKHGEITLTRPDGRLATLMRTGQPDRAVPLPRRGTEELLAEELRRLDPDDVYNETIQCVFGHKPSSNPTGPRRQAAIAVKAAAAKKSAGAKTAAPAKTAAGKPTAAPTAAPAKKAVPAKKVAPVKKTASGARGAK